MAQKSKSILIRGYTMINDYIKKTQTHWNGNLESVKNTILADILLGLWEVCEDIHYDKLAEKYEKHDLYYNDDSKWYN